MVSCIVPQGHQFARSDHYLLFYRPRIIPNRCHVGAQFTPNDATDLPQPVAASLETGGGGKKSDQKKE